MGAELFPTVQFFKREVVVLLYVITVMVRRGHYFLCSSNTIPRTGGPSQFYATKESPKNIKYWENYRHGLVLLSRLVFKKEISRAPSASYMKIRSPLYINDKKETESFLLVENQHSSLCTRGGFAYSKMWSPVY